MVLEELWLLKQSIEGSIYKMAPDTKISLPPEPTEI